MYLKNVSINSKTYFKGFQVVSKVNSLTVLWKRIHAYLCLPLFHLFCNLFGLQLLQENKAVVFQQLEEIAISLSL